MILFESIYDLFVVLSTFALLEFVGFVELVEFIGFIEFVGFGVEGRGMFFPVYEQLFNLVG